MKIPSSLIRATAAKLGDFFTSGNEDEILGAIDVALRLPAGFVTRRVESLRDKHPNASEDELMEIITSRFISRASFSGGATGAAAFIPGFGTVAGVALSTAQLATFLVHAAYMVLSVAELKGISVTSQTQRRTLLLAALLGEDGAHMATEQLGTTGSLWAKATLQKMTGTSGSTVNRILAKYAAKRAPKKAGKQLIGRALPLGLGAAIGWYGTRSMAREVVAGTYAGLGMVANTVETVKDTDQQPNSVVLSQ